MGVCPEGVTIHLNNTEPKEVYQAFLAHLSLTCVLEREGERGFVCVCVCVCVCVSNGIDIVQ